MKKAADTIQREMEELLSPGDLRDERSVGYFVGNDVPGTNGW